MKNEHSKEKPWSLKHEKCVKCGQTVFRHIARGLCLKCYETDTAKRNRGIKKLRREYGFATETMTYEYLVAEYVNNQKSLGDIAKECDCSRQMVYKKLKQFSITPRDKTESRQLAHEKGKVVFHRIDKDGQETSVVADRTHVNEEFFSKWSPEMAYVLGVICTDGNLSMPHIRDGRYKNNAGTNIKRLNLSQKEPELLEKVLKLMDCNARLVFSPKMQYGEVISGEKYFFNIHNDRIFADLLSLGLTPNKSRTLKFPPVPDEHLRHFIRGCWDGDGSVSVYEDSTRTKTPLRINASFTSGSPQFIETMVKRLRDANLERRNIQKAGVRSYCITFSDKTCKPFYEYLYKDVQPDLFLERKFNLFVKYFGRLDSNLQNQNSNEPNPEV